MLKIAEELGLTVRQQLVPREMLYSADELFFTGTASEVDADPVGGCLQVGEGRRGPVTERIQRRYLELVKGEGPDPWGWLTYV